MPVSIGPRIQVDGEEKYRQQINQIIQQTKTLDAEMGALTASFDKNATEQEKARKSTELLAKQLEAARQRTELVREMTEKSAAATGENSAQTLKWREALANAEAQQAKLEHAVQENTAAIEGQTDAEEESTGKMVSLGDAVDQVAGKLGINLPDGAKKALNGMESLSAGTVAKMGAVAAAVAAVVKVVKELNDMTLEAASRADDLMTQSVTSGISTDLLQAYQYAAPFIDVSADTIVAANKKIGLSIASAAEQYAAYSEAAANAAAQGKEYEGNLGAQAEAFQRLGVSVTDSTGQMRDSQTVMTEVLAALGGIGNQTERNSLANDLLGKSYDELAPIIQDQEKFQQLLNEAMESGYVLNEQQLEILGEVDDAHEKYTQTIEKNKNLIATQWAPASKEAYEALASLMDKAGKALVDSGLVSNFAALVQSTLGLVEAGSDLISALPSWMNPLEQLSNTIRGLALVMAAVADYADVVKGLMTFDFNRVGTALGWNIGKGQMSHVQQIRRSGSEYVSYNAAGTSDWRGGLTWVGEAGPELVRLPQHSQILSNQESRALAGGDQHIVINVQGIEQLDQVVRWYESRRVRERMR